MHSLLSVLTTEIIRRELRDRRIGIAEAGRLLAGLLDDPDPLVSEAATSLVLELEQIDPLEPNVRAVADAVHAKDEHLALPPKRGVGSEGTGDQLLFARTLLGARRPDSAERELALVLALDPDNPVARSLLVRVKQVQGKLSEAIRIWEATSPLPTDGQSALVELGMLYQASQQPERHAPGPQRIGHDGTGGARYVAHVGLLERAFRFASAGEFGLATDLCDRVMAQHRAGDRSVYKLAAIEKAWLVEAAGRADEAVALLEALGGEPDLAEDNDRLVSLGRLYEGRTDVHPAIQTYEHLFERTGELSYLTRVAKLHARAGDTVRAEAIRLRHLAAFEQEVGDIRLAQLLRAIVRHHLPIAELESFRYADDELAREWQRLGAIEAPGALRGRALVAVLRGDRAAAAELFGRLARGAGAGAVDLAYLGELEALAGRTEVASACYWGSVCKAEAGGTAPDPLALAGLLLTSRAEPGATPAAIASIVAEPTRLADASESLVDLARMRPYDPLAWRALAEMMRHAGRVADAARHERRAEFLEREAGPKLSPPGHALTAAVYHARGDRRGIVHELWARRVAPTNARGGSLAEGHVFANLTDDLRTYLRSVFESVKTYARAKFCHLVDDMDSYAYQFKLTNEDEPSSGPSAGLAIAISFLSVFLDRPVPEDVALSGVLVTEARDVLSIRRIGDADIKVHGALARRLRRIVLPYETKRDVEESDLVPQEASSRVVVYVKNLDEALEAVFGEDVWLW